MKSAMNSPVSSVCSIKRLILVLLAVFGFAGTHAAERADTVVRPVLSAYMLELGSAHFCDTYLTPLHYSGWQGALSYSRMQAMRFDPEHWIMDLGGRLSLSRTLNPARNAAMWDIGFNPRWSILRRWHLPAGFTLAAGGDVDFDIGALYLARNGNNPISARASLTIGVTALAAWNGRVGRLPLTLAYRPAMPLVGAFFSPDYDELYYEIWLGNHAGLCHAAWPGDFFRLDNLLTADLHFGATTLRLGYRCDVFSSKAAGIVSRRVTHSFVLGICAEWISLRAGSRRTPDARIISALY